MVCAVALLDVTTEPPRYLVTGQLVPVPHGRNEAGFIGYVFLYLKPGTGAEVAELLRQGNELRRRHNIRDAIIVTSSVVGYDAPMLLLRIHARDVNDYYTQTARNAEMMGEEFANIVRQVAGHTRYIETSNNVQRRDLSYQPEN